MFIAILGRQPRLAAAELESVYGPAAISMLDGNIARIDTAHISHERLGGTVKLCRILYELPGMQWDRITDSLLKYATGMSADIPEGKLTIGLSVYGLRVNERQLFRTGLELKKACRGKGRSVRLVPNNGPELNSAQVLHNKLTGPQGAEFCIVKVGTSVAIAQTVSIQNIEEYAKRDHGRPKRDAFVGMLPPKLAQIMLNLSGAQPGERILDPFCGTGVVLQEAALAGCQVYGTDIQPRMIDYTAANLEWLKLAYNLTVDVTLKAEDATTARWEPPLNHVVCETYLGQPLSGLPRPEKLQQIIQNCNTITKAFLRNLKPQLVSGTRICIAVPAWQTANRLKHLQMLDDLENMGYNRVRFQHAKNEDLIYHREDQIVARELLVLTVK